MFYRLNEDGTVECVGSIEEWGESFMNHARRRVSLDERPGRYVVSTVFLGLDHNFDGGPPLLFETMVFLHGRGTREYDMRRYSTIEQARAGHEALVKKWRWFYYVRPFVELWDRCVARFRR